MESDNQLELQINDQIDVRWMDNQWYIATIIDINNEQIKIHYQCEGDDNTSNEWIRKTSDRIAKPNSHTGSLSSISIDLANCPINYAATKSIHYKHNEHGYILYCINHIGSIYRYDINNNNWDKLSDYPSDFNPMEEDAICFNKAKSKLYLFSLCSMEPIGTMATYNIQNDEWTLKKCILVAATYDDLEFCTAYNACFTEYPNKAIHLFHVQKHWKIIDDEIKNECKAILLNDFSMGYFLNDSIWCDEFQALIAVQTKNYGKHPVCFCRITAPNQTKYDWQMFRSVTQSVANFENKISFELILAFEHILFVFTPIISGGGSSEYNLWCIDLLFHQKFWVAEFDNMDCTASIVKTDDNYIHYIYSSDSGSEMHYKISLFDLIPVELNDLYHETLSDPLVFGYIAEMNKSDQLSACIPVDIVYIILAFFPPLL